MSKREIIPAILEKDFKAIEKKIKILEKSFLKKERSFFVQIDICDGSLTPEKTFLSNGRKDSFEKLKKISKTFFLELDLIMDFKKIKNKKSFFKNLKSTGAKRVVFHNQGVQN
jgi:pentose-5-phosphate-3-epimerase